MAGANAKTRLLILMLTCSWFYGVDAVHLEKIAHAEYVRLKRCFRALFQFGVLPLTYNAKVANSLCSITACSWLSRVVKVSNGYAIFATGSRNYVIFVKEYLHQASSIG